MEEELTQNIFTINQKLLIISKKKPTNIKKIGKIILNNIFKIILVYIATH